ncbi:MAG: DUF4139 domain-containing protein [Syntrophorhabdaceae bacterium]|nr:DUF4139 domain-containing protein [Syntrophorhabdaceae bacterium]
MPHDFFRLLFIFNRVRAGFVLTVLLLCAMLSDSPAFAAALGQPKSVIFYPRAAQLTVEERLKPQDLPGGGKGVVLRLPIHADRQSFSLNITDGHVSGLVWQEVEVDDESSGQGERGALLRELSAARAELALARAAVTVNKKRAELLSKAGDSGERIKGVDEVEKLDALLGRQLTALMAERPALERNVENLQRRFEKAEQKLGVLGGEILREMSVTVALDGAPDTVTARYTYMLPGCGWTPVYTAEALPDKGMVVFTQEADLWQNTRIQWNNADITVATNTPDSRPAPGLLPAWLLQVYRPQPVMARSKMMANTELSQSMPVMSEEYAENEMMDAPSTEAPPMPIREEKTTFALWRVGKRGIPVGSYSRVILAKEQWKADFYYTVRPMLEPRGFLTAAAKPAKPVDLPQGPAIFMVDGTIIGSSSLALYGDSLKLYFGADPLVTATMRSEQRQSGESGLISKDQTITWNWSITVKNGRAKPVIVQVEDPSPESGDGAIKLDVTSNPKPELNNKAYTWRLSLEPGETKQIDHLVKAAAPKEISLSPGR